MNLFLIDGRRSPNTPSLHLPDFAGWRVTMTTEASSETEVKENAEESAAQLDQSEKTAGESQEVGSREGEPKEKEKTKDGKGISRYLPTWLKKQKSQSQVGAPHRRSFRSLASPPTNS